MKKTLAILVIFATLTLQTFANNSASALSDIKNFRVNSPTLASAGMPEEAQFSVLKQQGFTHIINLIPGKFSAEEELTKTLGIDFKQIPIVWHQPTIEDFKVFVTTMNKYTAHTNSKANNKTDSVNKQPKVLVHCQLNYRASAFVYLYQVTQLGMDPEQAQQQLHTVWQPEGIWQHFIEEVIKHYKSTPA